MPEKSDKLIQFIVFFVCLPFCLENSMKGKIDLESTVYELKRDNEKSLETLFDYYYPRLYNFSKTFLKIDDGIDDLLQEVFIKIWKKRKSINTTSNFNSFIFTITRNLLLNELRGRLNNQKMKDEIRNLSVAPEYESFEKTEYEELKQQMEKIVEDLPERQKEIFILSRTEGLSHNEIAKKLDITTKTVEYHISLAIKTLKSRFRELGLVSLLYFYLFW